MATVTCVKCGATTQTDNPLANCPSCNTPLIESGSAIAGNTSQSVAGNSPAPAPAPAAASTPQEDAQKLHSLGIDATATAKGIEVVVPAPAPAPQESTGVKIRSEEHTSELQS